MKRTLVNFEDLKKPPAEFSGLQGNELLNFDNNASFDCYISDEQQNLELCLCECGYEKCEPFHYWGYGNKKVFSLHIVLNGKGTLFFNNKTYYPHKGQIFLLKPNDMIYYIADQTEPWEYQWISFIGTKATSGILKTILSNTPVADNITPNEFERLFYEIKNHSSSNEFDDYTVTGYLYLLLALLIKKYPSSIHQEEVNYKTKEFNKILHFIASNINNATLVSDLASHFGYNRSHLYKMFKRYMDMSPKEYILALKINLACEYIISDKYPLEKIAIKLGFKDYVTFYRNFKALTGFSPNEYYLKQKLSRRHRIGHSEKRKHLNYKG